MKKFLIRAFLFLMRLGIFLGILFLLVKLGTYTYEFGYQIYSDRGVEASPGKDLAIVIYEDESLQEIAEMLARFGLIKDEKVFIVQERLSKYHGEIKPGNYILNTSMSGNDMILVLTGHDHDNEESEEIEE